MNAKGLPPRIAAVLAVALACVVPIPMATAAAEGEHAVLRLDLAETIRRAIETSEELKIKGSEVDRASGTYGVERAGLLPHLNGQTGWAYTIDSPGDFGLNNYYDLYGVTASQLVWSFGRVGYAVASARRAVEASRFDRDAGRQEIVYTATQAYYSAVLAKNSLGITEKSYANAVANKKLLGRRAFGGRSSTYEILKMDTEVAVRVPTVNEARTQYDAALETLKKLVDADYSTRIELTEDFREKYEAYDYDVLVSAMYEYEPFLKSLAKSEAAADANVKSKYASFLPTVSAFTNLNYLGGDDGRAFQIGHAMDRFAFVGFKVDVPIWEGGRTEAQLRQARADREIARLRVKQFERKFLLELKKASLEYRQYNENLEANLEAVGLSEESFKQTQEMFTSGQASLTDLNDAELLLTNQRINKETTLFNINATLARMEKLVAGHFDDRDHTREKPQAKP